MKLVSEQEPLFIFINRPFHLIDKRFKGWIFSIFTALWMEILQNVILVFYDFWQTTWALLLRRKIGINDFLLSGSFNRIHLV